MLSKISTPKANAIGRKYNGFENKSTVVSPPSSTKHSEPRGHFFNFPGTTKARAKGINASDMMAAMAQGVIDNSKKDKNNFKNMSGPIQFEKESQSVWNHNFSGLSHNSSSSRLGTKDRKKGKPSTSNTRTSEKYEVDANREMMKKITSDNKYFAILKKITQDTGRHYSYTNTATSNATKYNKSKERGIKEYEVVDSSGGTADNLAGTVTTANKSERRMYGTEKIDMKKYNNIIGNVPILAESDKPHDKSVDKAKPVKIEYPLTPGKALKYFMDRLSDYEK